VPMAPDNVRRRPAKPDPWAIPGSSSAFTLTRENKEGLLAQRQLAAVDLLEHDRPDASADAHWTPQMLCNASGLSAAQLRTLVRDGIIAIEEIEARRDPLTGRNIPASHPLPLTPGQQAALEPIIAMPSKTPILLHGVTGSGKTEVYLQALAAIIAQGKRGIMLVPEIALTAQAVYRFVGRFPGRVAIIHSALTDGERYDEWRRIRAGKVDVVIGSRSALFAPLPDLGMLILDEEHEPAYKQSERRPTYHAREAAIALGRMLSIPVVLGSVTPSVESFYRAEQQAYHLVKLPDRIGATLPPVEIIDLRDELHAGNTSIISRRLYGEIEQVLSRGQQAILYLNRRGAASCVLCRECGFVAMCDKCDVPLTYHATERVLLCHYCNSQSKVLRNCPQCGSESMRYFGLGTEKVVDTIERSFPNARLLRWDRDTAKNRRAHEQLLDRFANREADILVGTQMIAKGLDLPGVTLVGVISADIALMLPDFSASERAFTLLTQVAGRAGRGEEAGQVIIQTFNPQHFCIDAASRHDYSEFYAAEIEARRRYGYPPFRQFVKFTYSHENRRRSQNEALLLREKLDNWIARLGLAQTDIVGPAPALMERVNNKYRWQMIARGPDLHPLLRVLDTPGWDVDIDPVSTM
jgi:primosomal protein N' (replication factor Y) (superfamily II helicase)